MLLHFYAATVTAVVVEWCNLTASTISDVPASQWEKAKIEEIRCIPDDACEGLKSDQLGALSTACAGWSGCFSYAPPAAFKGMGKKCFEAVPKLAAFFLTREQLRNIPPRTFEDLTTAVLTSVPVMTCSGFTVEQFSAIQKSKSSCKHVEPECFDHLDRAVVLPTTTAACVGALKPDTFYDIPIEVFLTIPPSALELTTEQLGYLAGVCAGFNVSHLKVIERGCEVVRGRCFELLRPAVTSELSPQCVAGLANSTVSKITKEQFAAMSVQQFGSFSAGQMASIVYPTCLGISPSLMRSRPDACQLLPTSCGKLCAPQVAALALPPRPPSRAASFAFTASILALLSLFVAWGKSATTRHSPNPPRCVTEVTPLLKKEHVAYDCDKRL